MALCKWAYNTTTYKTWQLQEIYACIGLLVSHVALILTYEVCLPLGMCGSSPITTPNQSQAADCVAKK